MRAFFSRQRHRRDPHEMDMALPELGSSVDSSDVQLEADQRLLPCTVAIMNLSLPLPLHQHLPLHLQLLTLLPPQLKKSLVQTLFSIQPQ